MSFNALHLAVWIFLLLSGIGLAQSSATAAPSPDVGRIDVTLFSKPPEGVRRDAPVLRFDESMLADKRIRPFGVVQENVVDIYIHAPALKAAVEHARTETRKEVGGLLLGRPYRRDGRLQVVIHAAVETKSAVSGELKYEFPEAAWAEAESFRAAHHPGSVIVGWYHTHPGNGIFLSGYDVRAYETCFGAPWNVALVIDPVADKLGFFEWHGSRISKAGFRTIAEPNAK